MSTPRLILAAFALFFHCLSFSQPICGFDQIQHKLMKENAAYRQKVMNFESHLRMYIQQHKELQQSKNNLRVLGGLPYMIPVVVHVINTGGAIGTIYNPSDAQIQGAINYLNAVYNGTYPGIQGAGDLGIQFVLAQRDPPGMEPAIWL
ncbi:MAG TPA: hypothetical protein VMH01_01840 [Puia sp.]|nr:hypothetical protein [Puia sp.]